MTGFPSEDTVPKITELKLSINPLISSLFLSSSECPFSLNFSGVSTLRFFLAILAIFIISR